MRRPVAATQARFLVHEEGQVFHINTRWRMVDGVARVSVPARGTSTYSMISNTYCEEGGRDSQSVCASSVLCWKYTHRKPHKRLRKRVVHLSEVHVPIYSPMTYVHPFSPTHTS